MSMEVETRGLAGRRVLAIAVMIGGLGVSACEDDPVDTGDREEGIASFRIREVGGTVLYEYAGPTNAAADTLFLPGGEAIEIAIEWLDEDGGVLELEPEEHPWTFAENHSAIVSFTPSTSEPWQGTISTTPLLPGATVYGGFSVTLFHGEEAEFETPQLVAAVEGD